SVAEMMTRERRLGPEQQQAEESEADKIRPNRRGLPQNPHSPALAQWPSLPDHPQAPSKPSQPQTLGLSFTAATMADTGTFPPDSMGAVGPAQFIVAVNGRIRSFSKADGLPDGALNVTTNTFFQAVSNGT